jgi:hypothetical protein
MLKENTRLISLKAAWQLTQPEGVKVYSPLVTQRIVLLDHLHIYQTKKQIDDVLSILNEMKMADKNMSFIIYFHLTVLWRICGETLRIKKSQP